MSIILSLDQATSCGWAVFDGSELLDFGKFMAKGCVYQDKIMDISLKVQGLIKEYKPDIVTIEDVQLTKLNPLTYSKLSGLKFVLEHEFAKSGIRYLVFKPSVWRSELGIKTKPRELSKAQAIAYVNDKYGLSVTNDDEADAICQGVYTLILIENGEINA